MRLHVYPLDLGYDPAITYLCLGGFIVFFSMISLLAKERLYVGELVLATTFGIIIGPYGANIFNPRSWSDDSNHITLEVMRTSITLAAGLFAIGVELPQAYMARHWRSLLSLAVPTMAVGWVTSAGFMFLLFPGLNFISALCISACLTPTDPILAVAITSGKFAMTHVPVNIRQIIAAESAANDGLAYPFLSISLCLTLESSKKTAIGKWFLMGWLYQVIIGTLIGACLGFGFCHIMRYSLRKRWIDRESYVAQYIALALLTIGLTNLLSSDDLLAAFAAGTAVSWDGDFKMQTENAVFSSVIDLVLNCGAFIYIGAWLPFKLYNSSELNITPWRLIVLFLCLLAFRRLPSLLMLYRWIPDVNGWREAVFSGHFDPMGASFLSSTALGFLECKAMIHFVGVGAIFISTLALSKLPEPHMPPQNQQERLAASLHPIVSFVVLGSILTHGLTIPFFSLGRRTVSLTSTWSRSPPNPEWLNQTLRVTKGVRPGSDDVDTMELGGRAEYRPRDSATPSRLHTSTRSVTPLRGDLDGNSLTSPSVHLPSHPPEALIEGKGVRQVEFHPDSLGRHTGHGGEVGSQSFARTQRAEGLSQLATSTPRERVRDENLTASDLTAQSRGE